MTKNIVNENVQGTETSVKKVNYKGTTKDVFEVGCQYETTYGPKFEVIARKGNKLTIKYLRSEYYHNAGDIENKRIYLAGCEETNFTELLKWNYGAEVFPIRKVQGAEASENELKEEYCELQSIVAETLYEAREKVLDAVGYARKAKEIEPQDIEYLQELMEEIDEIESDIERLLNEL